MPEINLTIDGGQIQWVRPGTRWETGSTPSAPPSFIDQIRQMGVPNLADIFRDHATPDMEEVFRQHIEYLNASLSGRERLTMPDQVAHDETEWGEYFSFMRNPAFGLRGNRYRLFLDRNHRIIWRQNNRDYVMGSPGLYQTVTGFFIKLHFTTPNFGDPPPEFPPEGIWISQEDFTALQNWRDKMSQTWHYTQRGWERIGEQ